MVDDVLPSSLINSNVNLRWKHRKSKDLKHAPWLTTLWRYMGVLEHFWC
jgi:hypothetical protein